MGSCYQCGQSVSGPGTCPSCSCYNTAEQCGCGSSAPYTPQPYYTAAPLCEEQCGPTAKVYNPGMLVTPKNQWNIPEVGENAILAVEGFCNFHIGSYIWSSVYGYLEIVGWNQDVGQLTVRNNGHESNASDGTPVPLCSTFIVTDPPFSSGAGDCDSFPHVAVDFIAPIEGNVTSIEVTTVVGLAVGKNIQIGTGIYKLVGINFGNIIDILNEGEGLVAGTLVEGLGDNGECNTLISPIDTNVCTNEAVNQGAIVVCFDGIQQPLNGAMIGSVPVLIDPEDNLVEFQLLDVPTRTCTPISDCCFNLIPGQSTYILTVGDSSIFIVGDLVQLGSLSFRFEITDIIDDTHIEVEIDSDPAEIIEIAAGTSVCLASCCEQLEDRIEDLESLTPIFGAHISPVVNGILNSGNVEFMAETANVMITNPSATKTLTIQSTHGIITEGFANDACPALGGDHLKLQYHIQRLLDNVAQDVSNQDFTIGAANNIANVNSWDQYLNYPAHFTIPPGGSVLLRTRVFFRWVSPGASNASFNFSTPPNFLNATLGYFGTFS